MSVGKDTDIDSLGYIPSNFDVKNSVNQIQILQNTDVFITHCGMNSVNESIYYGVPMVLFPQHLEQRMVGNRVSQLESGVILKKNNIEEIRSSVIEVMNNSKYKENTDRLSQGFHNSGGAKKAADEIEKICSL